MDLSHYYRARTKESVDADRAKINSRLQELVREGLASKFRLSTYYKGLPISYPATIDDFGFGVLNLEVHQQQAVALDTTRRAFITCDQFDCSLLCDVVNVDVRRRSAALKNFSYVDVMAERRESLRLQLEPRTSAEVLGAWGGLSGELSDISLGGCCIRTERHARLQRGSEYKLRLKIPNLLQNTLQNAEIPARLLEVTRDPENDICSFVFCSDGSEETVISRYTFQRQVEIVRELKDAS